MKQETKQETATHFVPAEPGWLALFEHEVDGQLVVRAEPVIAWCFGPRDPDAPDVSFGRAVVGARPWLEKADVEETSHFFALVREEQLDADFLAELRQGAKHSREEILAAARRNRDDRQQGHPSWLRERRSHRGEWQEPPPPNPIKIL
jgi:hypothetical protein